MSQNIFPDIDPFNTSGEELAVILNQFRDAVISGFSGIARPADLEEGGVWVDTSQEASPNFTWSLKLWTGTFDIVLFDIKTNSGEVTIPGTSGTFHITRKSNDAVGPEASFEKSRVSGGGQVLDGDSIGTWTFTSSDNTGEKRLAARIDVIAVGNTTSSQWGTKFSIKVTDPSGTTLSEKIVVGEDVYVKTRLTTDAMKLVSQDVASAASITDLSSAKSLVRITGTTETTLHGILASGLSKVVTVHNATNKNINIESESTGAAAADRFLLNKKLKLLPLTSAEFFYDETASRWKQKTGTGSGSGTGILTVADQTAREAIDAEERYDGLYVYQVDNKTMWQLRGGITNDKWVLLDVGLVLNTAQVFSANGEITLQSVMTQRVLISGNTAPYTATLPTPTLEGQRVWVCGQSDQYPITLNGIDFTNGKNRWFQNVGGTWVMEE